MTVTPVGATGTTEVPTASVANVGANTLDKQAFLKLLVAQLKYQDPMNPTDSAEFMAQTAQFTQVEKLDEIAKQNADNIRTQGLSTASALIGRSITYQDSLGAFKTGVVAGASLSTDGVRLKVGTGAAATTADLEAVTEIGPAPSGPATGSA
ncbi:MAG: flagellar hook capping FlgD N-terminal domain-containing protein [Microthrixaceae bacterium]